MGFRALLGPLFGAIAIVVVGACACFDCISDRHENSRQMRLNRRQERIQRALDREQNRESQSMDRNVRLAQFMFLHLSESERPAMLNYLKEQLWLPTQVPEEGKQD
uniref:Uncharacterized protein n=1 Tax=Spongospora subterranea TaxID=70186 RepID=A0A0H5RGC6_9EUKA|eukprot:CRZ12776.1 hypothetical protein [Spongospora subterranea]